MSEGQNCPYDSRRSILTFLALSTCGCLSSGDQTETENSNESAPTPSSTQTSTSETPTSALNQTPSTSPTETATVAVNRTQYAVGSPVRDGVVESSVGPLLGDGVGNYSVAVRLIQTQKNWKQLLDSVRSSISADVRGYSFVENTDFESQAFVIVQASITTSCILQLLSVDKQTETAIRLLVRRAGISVTNAQAPRLLFVRVPSHSHKITRVTAEVNILDKDVMVEDNIERNNLHRSSSDFYGKK